MRDRSGGTVRHPITRQDVLMKTYKTEARAMQRVHWLVTEYGVWPAVVSQDDGRYRLSFDPMNEYDND
jgi:hypothetical protein